jgi:hypothetical protein
MRRRRFVLTSLAGVVAGQAAAGGQQRVRTWRIAWLAEERDPGRESQAPGGGRWFFEALRDPATSTTITFRSSIGLPKRERSDCQILRRRWPA